MTTPNPAPGPGILDHTRVSTSGEVRKGIQEQKPSLLVSLLIISGIRGLLETTFSRPEFWPWIS